MEKKPLLTFLLRLGDDSLILGQRLSEWCGHGPILEEDIALTNTALDLIGQATNIYTYAAEVQGENKDADALAFLRLEHEYFNAILTEQPNGNFADTIVRQFFFDTYRKLLWEQLVHSSDARLAAIAEKSLKETRYHFKHSAEWVIRLGDGTEDSNERTQLAIHSLWRYTEELFYTDDTEEALQALGVIPAIQSLRKPWLETVEKVLLQGTLIVPEDKGYFGKGRQGMHSENMGFLLAQLQYMQRAYPNMQW
jgi:ring-1,2-phenylacetyl-CoA epoxidase subunit PaaC